MNLLSPEYLFSKNLGPFTSNLAWFLLGAILLAMVLAWLVRYKFVKNRDIFAKKAAKKLFQAIWTTGFISLVFWLFRQINVMYLGAPMFLLATAAASLVWLAFVGYYWFKTVPSRRAQLSREDTKKRYLPPHQ